MSSLCVMCLHSSDDHCVVSGACKCGCPQGWYVAADQPEPEDEPQEPEPIGGGE